MTLLLDFLLFSPHTGAPRGNNGPTCFLGLQSGKRGCLSSVAPGFALRNRDVSHPLLPGNFRLPNEGFTVWRQLRIIIALNLATPVSWTTGFQTEALSQNYREDWFKDRLLGPIPEFISYISNKSLGDGAAAHAGNHTL